MSRLAPVVLLVACSGLVGCSGSSTPATDAPDDGFDRAGLLAHLSTRVLLPMQGAMATATAALPAAITSYCQALDGGAAGATREGAHAAWRAAMDTVERADALLIGPGAMDAKTLRDRIYAWPLLSTCAIDRDTATSWTDPGSFDVATRLVNARSLTALEYLLFSTAAQHTCATEPAGWSALGADLPRARCRQALALATDVASAAATVDAGWRTDGGDYTTDLAHAGQAGSSIPSAQEGINRISDAMFYVDRMVKDMKLAEAAGIAINACGTVGTPCDREVELRYADRATIAIRLNLVTLREAFTGTTPTADGPGFDDFLRALDNAPLADRMVGSLDAAIAAANALPDSFTTALVADYAKVVATHTAVDAFTTDLKSQFLTVLALEIPDDVAADND